MSFFKRIYASITKASGEQKYQVKHEYARTSTSDSDTLLSEEGDVHEKTRVNARLRPRFQTFTTIGMGFFAVLSLFLLAGFLTKRPTDRECARQLNTYSPLLDTIEYEEIEFENMFAHQTKYRGPPTRELEQAWRDLWYFNGIKIPKEKMYLLNRTDSDTEWRATNDGKGYHALIEVFHQLHCLNLIRQYTWREYYPKHPELHMPTDLKDSEVGARMHVDHCIEALRIALMCHGDTTPFLVKVDPESPVGFMADFSPHHKCVRFDGLIEYMEENVED